MVECRCGCGQEVRPPNTAYVNKEHQLEHLGPGGEGARLNQLQPREAKQAGGRRMGTEAAKSGRLAEAGLKGAARAHELAEKYRRRKGPGVR